MPPKAAGKKKAADKPTSPAEPDGPTSSGTPNWVPILAGVLIGLGVLAIAYKLFSKSKPTVSFVCYKKPPPPSGVSIPEIGFGSK